MACILSPHGQLRKAAAVLESAVANRTATIRVLRKPGPQSHDGSLFQFPRRRDRIYFYLQPWRTVHRLCLLYKAHQWDYSPRKAGSGVRLDVCRDAPKGPIRGWRGVSTPTSTDRSILIHHHIGQNYGGRHRPYAPRGSVDIRPRLPQSDPRISANATTAIRLCDYSSCTSCRT
jgi:hypothetical protein